jgi:hypothetical protein
MLDFLIEHGQFEALLGHLLVQRPVGGFFLDLLVVQVFEIFVLLEAVVFEFGDLSGLIFVLFVEFGVARLEFIFLIAFYNLFISLRVRFLLDLLDRFKEAV